MTIPKWLTSSADEEKLALTIKGILTGIGPVLLLLSNAKGWHLTQTDLDVVIDGVLNALATLTAFISAAMVACGIARKIYYSITTPPQV